VLVADAPFTAGVHVMGGAPGTRETDLLAPDRVVEQVDALVLSGGSAFGLDAASGVADGLRDMGRGFAVGGCRVPIVPGAILFDLLNGGDKNWSENPYRALGRTALEAASDALEIGSTGAGTGATTATLKGGLGSASAILPDGTTVGALVAVNALGSATVGESPEFWAAPFEVGQEFGGLGTARSYPDPMLAPTKLAQHANTTIGIVATDADERIQCGSSQLWGCVLRSRKFDQNGRGRLQFPDSGQFNRQGVRVRFRFPSRLAHQGYQLRQIAVRPHLAAPRCGRQCVERHSAGRAFVPVRRDRIPIDHAQIIGVASLGEDIQHEFQSIFRQIARLQNTQQRADGRSWLFRLLRPSDRRGDRKRHQGNQ